MTSGTGARAADPVQGAAPPSAADPQGAADRSPQLTAQRSPRVHATGRRRPWLVRAVRAFGSRLVVMLFTLRVTDASATPTGQVIYAGNHASFLDGPLVFLVAPRPAVFLVKAEMFVRGLDRALGWLGQVPVHRDRADRQALRAALDELAAGRAVGMFPEGSRGSGTIEQLQHGIALLALRSGAPVVPVAVLGTAAALPRGTGRLRLRAPVVVEFGPPFTVTSTADPRSRRAVSQAADQIREHLVAHLVTVRTTAGMTA